MKAETGAESPSIDSILLERWSRYFRALGDGSFPFALSDIFFRPAAAYSATSELSFSPFSVRPSAVFMVLLPGCVDSSGLPHGFRGGVFQTTTPMWYLVWFAVRCA